MVVACEPTALNWAMFELAAARVLVKRIKTIRVKIILITITRERGNLYMATVKVGLGNYCSFEWELSISTNLTAMKG